jgi:hypothetical protein
MPWRSTFWQNWDKFFRATKLVEQNARLYLHYDEILLEGYPLDAQASQTAGDPHAVTFSFNFLVTAYVDLAFKQGYTTARKYARSLVSPGYGESLKQFEIRDDRVSLLEFVGLAGAAKAAGQVQAGMTSVGASGDLAGLAGGTAYDVLSGGATAKGLVTAGLSAAFELLTPNMRPGTPEEQLRYATGGKINLKPDEINKWFGLIRDVMRGERTWASLAIPPALQKQLSEGVVGMMNYTGGGPTRADVPRAGALVVSAIPLP